MFTQTMGIYNIVWWSMACVALWLLYRIYELIKALHFMELDRFKREHPRAFQDE